MMNSPTFSPYHNLILTGYMGVGKVAVGKAIAHQLGVVFVDLDTEIHLREGMSGEEIRQLFGESRVRTLENQLCGELSLRRSSVLSISGVTLLDEDNRRRLANSGPVLVLTCALNEILRRLHVVQGARFHDPKVRSAALTQIRREQQIHRLPALPSLDTTTLTVEQVAEQALAFWKAQDILA